MSRPERVVVALTGGPEGEVLLRRAAALVGRESDDGVAPGELHSVYVVRPGTGGASDPTALARLRGLTEELGGTHHTITGGDPAAGRARLRAQPGRHPGRGRRRAAVAGSAPRSGPG